MTTNITVQDNAESGTYEAVLDGKVVGIVVYEHEDSRIVFTHTIVEPEFRGQGIGSALIRGALDDVRAKGAGLTNFCSAVTDFIAAHPEYADLIDTAHPGRVQRD